MFGESSSSINNNVSEQYNNEDNSSNINLKSSAVSSDRDFVMQSDKSPQFDTNNNSDDNHTNRVASG